MIFSIAVIITSFLVGFAMKRAGLCTYAAILQIVNVRRADRLFDFLAASAWATVAIIICSWIWPNSIQLSGSHEQYIFALIGGIILGLGAYINKGCIFGTFVQIVGGNLSYVTTLFGMSVGVIVMHEYLVNLTPAITQTSLVAQSGGVGWAWLICASLFALFMITKINVKPRAALAMLVLGIGGGLLFTAVNGWDFASVISKATLSVIDPLIASPGLLPIFCTLAMVAGGISAAVSAGSFSLQAPRFSPLIGHFIGGILMGAAAFIIPGGNDGMLLKGIPSLAPHSIIGFIAMLLAMFLLLKQLPNDQGYIKPTS